MLYLWDVYGNNSDIAEVYASVLSLFVLTYYNVMVMTGPVIVTTDHITRIMM